MDEIQILIEANAHQDGDLETMVLREENKLMKQEILRYLVKSGDPSQIGFKLHDFGFRGSTSVESSAIGGGAHLVNFLGTDTCRRCLGFTQSEFTINSLREKYYVDSPRF